MNDNKLAQVFHYDLYGKREEKYEFRDSGFRRNDVYKFRAGASGAANVTLGEAKDPFICRAAISPYLAIRVIPAQAGISIKPLT